QKSQVALGLILAQDPDLMIMDDFSMGLDPGYRRLFVEFLAEYGKAENKTIFVTSHIIQDLERLIDDVVIMGYEGVILQSSMDYFMNNFRQYDFKLKNGPVDLEKDDVVTNFDRVKNHASLYSFKSPEEVQAYLKNKQIEFEDFVEVPMTLEDAFIGITGKY
ncbi:MAG: ABC transporter ATP-binding protein, partial [Candidatus Marinimicrobia bacterium]|nr:ABC transporter ATP-binding protein [Candidatus Neomarinimicrobiota bacterium]